MLIFIERLGMDAAQREWMTVECLHLALIKTLSSLQTSKTARQSREHRSRPRTAHKRHKSTNQEMEVLHGITSEEERPMASGADLRAQNPCLFREPFSSCVAEEDGSNKSLRPFDGLQEVGSCESFT